MTNIKSQEVAKMSDYMAIQLAEQIVRENRDMYWGDYKKLEKGEAPTRLRAWEIISSYSAKRCDELSYSDWEHYNYVDIYNIARIKLNKFKPNLFERLRGVYN